VPAAVLRARLVWETERSVSHARLFRYSLWFQFQGYLYLSVVHGHDAVWFQFHLTDVSLQAGMWDAWTLWIIII